MSVECFQCLEKLYINFVFVRENNKNLSLFIMNMSVSELCVFKLSCASKCVKKEEMERLNMCLLFTKQKHAVHGNMHSCATVSQCFHHEIPVDMRRDASRVWRE